MHPVADDLPLSRAVRDQAIAWFTLAQSGCMTALEQQHLLQWRQANSEHERAWQRLASIPASLQRHANALADPLGRQLAGRSHAGELDRRKALKVLVGFGLLAGVAWQGRDSHLVQGSLADHRTRTGERSHVTLADGTQLWLNTDTAVDVRFTAGSRDVLLRYGEIDILSGSDPAQRPLRVFSADARLQPLGTRFRVRRADPGHGTLLAVSQGRVAASPLAGGAERVVEAGWQVRIAADGVSEPRPLQTTEGAWVDGFLVAERMRLGDFVNELGRYRPGLLRCDAAVADIRLSGAYPLDDSERILALLEDSLPVRAQRRTRYWVTLVPR